MPKKQQSNNQISVDIAVMAEKVDNIDKVVGNIQDKLEKDYATKEWVEGRFGGTRTAVSGILATFGLAIVSALATFVIRGGLK